MVPMTSFVFLTSSVISIYSIIYLTLLLNLVNIILMLMIRLQRVGRKNDPSFRVVLTDSKNGPRSGKFLEILGTYNSKAGVINFKEDRVKYWMSVGAKT